MTNDLQKCSQCGTTAMFECSGHPLCLSCTERLDSIQHAEFVRNAALYNKTAASLENTMPIPGYRAPRIDVPASPIRTGPITMKNINVKDSVVGAINSGTIQRLVVSLRDIRQTDSTTGDQLKQLIDGIQSEETFTPAQRQEALELLTSIAEQLNREEDDRQPAVLQTIAERVNRILTGSSKLASLWSAFCNTIGLTEFLGSS